MGVLYNKELLKTEPVFKWWRTIDIWTWILLFLATLFYSLVQTEKSWTKCLVLFSDFARSAICAYFSACILNQLLIVARLPDSLKSISNKFKDCTIYMSNNTIGDELISYYKIDTMVNLKRFQSLNMINLIENNKQAMLLQPYAVVRGISEQYPKLSSSHLNDILTTPGYSTIFLRKNSTLKSSLQFAFEVMDSYGLINALFRKFKTHHHEPISYTSMRPLDVSDLNRLILILVGSTFLKLVLFAVERKVWVGRRYLVEKLWVSFDVLWRVK